ncbi:cytochrome P450 82A3-like [Citrus clementina]|uniref:cytochrome P450 82A3-like n=1 Tax=Citrus clementina TaxID=85681 RepID=UPI000CED4756|nr:cytochrome P450 82A3-like [Citrus x clementina]
MVKIHIDENPADAFTKVIPVAKFRACLDLAGLCSTQLFVNAWKIQRDPSVWEEPCQFQPERFLTRYKDIDVRGQNFELIPFGSGRRMCPAVSLGLQVVQLTLASLVHAFDFTTPSDEPVDMGEAMGLAIAKATPLEVILSPRLSASLYG